MIDKKKKNKLKINNNDKTSSKILNLILFMKKNQMIGKIITAAAMNDCLKPLRGVGSVDFWRQLDNLDLVGFP